MKKMTINARNPLSLLSISTALILVSILASASAETIQRESCDLRVNALVTIINNEKSVGPYDPMASPGLVDASIVSQKGFRPRLWMKETSTESFRQTADGTLELDLEIKCAIVGKLVKSTLCSTALELVARDSLATNGASRLAFFDNRRQTQVESRHESLSHVVNMSVISALQHLPTCTTTVNGHH